MRLAVIDFCTMMGSGHRAWIMAPPAAWLCIIYPKRLSVKHRAWGLSADWIEMKQYISLKMLFLHELVSYLYAMNELSIPWRCVYQKIWIAGPHGSVVILRSWLIFIAKGKSVHAYCCTFVYRSRYAYPCLYLDSYRCRSEIRHSSPKLLRSIANCIRARFVRCECLAFALGFAYSFPTLPRYTIVNFRMPSPRWCESLIN